MSETEAHVRESLSPRQLWLVSSRERRKRVVALQGPVRLAEEDEAREQGSGILPQGLLEMLLAALHLGQSKEGSRFRWWNGASRASWMWPKKKRRKQRKSLERVMSPTVKGTGTATVTCTNWNGSSCSAWTDVPTAGANANVANLYSIGKNGAQNYVGSYELSFYITLTHP